MGNSRLNDTENMKTCSMRKTGHRRVCKVWNVSINWNYGWLKFSSFWKSVFPIMKVICFGHNKKKITCMEKERYALIVGRKWTWGFLSHAVLWDSWNRSTF